MHALAGQRVEVGGQRRDQGLALAGAHLGDAALVQHHAADQLHVEMTLAQGPLGGLAYDREGLDQKVVEGLTGGQTLPELVRSSPAGPDRRERPVAGSSALIESTVLRMDLTSRSFDEPNNRRARTPSMRGRSFQGWPAGGLLLRAVR